MDMYTERRGKISWVGAGPRHRPPSTLGDRRSEAAPAAPLPPTAPRRQLRTRSGARLGGWAWDQTIGDESRRCGHVKRTLTLDGVGGGGGCKCM
jgi:hypothetical protein